MKEQSTLKGFAVLSSAVIIVKLLSFIYIPFLRHILGHEGYGLYAASYQMFALIYAVTNSGLPSAISKIVSELTATGNYRDAVKAFKIARSTLLSAGVIMSIVLFVSAKPFARFMLFEKAYLSVAVLAPTVIFSTINSSYRGYFQGRRNMVPTALSQILEQIVNIFFTLLLSFLLIKSGVYYAVAGGTFATTIAAIFASIFLITAYKRNKEADIIKLQEPNVAEYTSKQLFKKIMDYSIPLTIYQALFYIGNIIDLRNVKSRLLVAGFKDAAANGLYGDLAVFNQLIGVPNAVIASLSVALLPSISASVARNDTDDVKEKINDAFKICFMISIPSAIGLSVLSSPIYRTACLGKGAYIMFYGAYILILMSCVQIFSAILQGLGKLYLVSFFLVFGVAGKIITNYLLVSIPSVNILGALVGSAVYYTVPLILDNIILIKTLKIKVNIFVHAVKPFIASLFMGVVIFLTYNGIHYLMGFITKHYLSYAIPCIAAFITGAYSYFFGLALIGGIREGDLKLLPAKIKRFIPKSIYRVIKA